jgi:hypothetical protein
MCQLDSRNIMFKWHRFYRLRARFKKQCSTKYGFKRHRVALTIIGIPMPIHWLIVKDVAIPIQLSEISSTHHSPSIITRWKSRPPPSYPFFATRKIKQPPLSIRSLFRSSSRCRISQRSTGCTVCRWFSRCRGTSCKTHKHTMSAGTHAPKLKIIIKHLRKFNQLDGRSIRSSFRHSLSRL